MSLNGQRHCCCYCCYCYCCCTFFFHACDEVTELSDVNREASISERTQPEVATTSIYHQERAQAQTKRMSRHKGASATYLSTRSTERPVRLNVLSAKNRYEGTRSENTPSRYIHSHVRLHWDYAIWQYANTHQVVSLEFNRYAAQHHNQQRKPMHASKHTSPQSARSSERTVRFDVVLRT